MPRFDVTVYSPSLSYLVTEARSGGAERQMGILVRELARRGCRVAVVVYPMNGPPVGLEPGITLVERGRRAATVRLVDTAVEAARVLWSLIRSDARVFIVRTGTPVVGILGLYARVRRRRLVFSSAINLDFIPSEKEGERRRLYDLGLKLADAIVVQSRDQVELARAACSPDARIVRIPSFADELEPRPTKHPKVFLWAGRLVDQKRPLLFARLAEALPEARFLFVPHFADKSTPESDAILPLVEEAARRLPNFELSLPLTHPELIDLLPAAVALVSTSEAHGEGMPNTFLEAWALGVPVLSLAFDPDDAIHDRGLGVAAGGSWEGFVAAAERMWDGQFDREGTGERARSYIEETHSVDVVVESWIDVVRSLGASVPG